MVEKTKDIRGLSYMALLLGLFLVVMGKFPEPLRTYGAANSKQNLSVKDKFKKTKIGSEFVKNFRKHKKYFKNTDLLKTENMGALHGKLLDMDKKFFELLRNEFKGIQEYRRYLSQLGNDTFSMRLSAGDARTGFEYYLNFSPPLILYRFGNGFLENTSSVIYVGENGLTKQKFPKSEHGQDRFGEKLIHFKVKGNHMVLIYSGPHGTGSFYNLNYYQVTKDSFEKVWNFTSGHVVNLNLSRKKRQVKIVSRTPKVRCVDKFELSQNVKQIVDKCK